MAKAEFVVCIQFPDLKVGAIVGAIVRAEKIILLLLRALARWQEIH